VRVRCCAVFSAAVLALPAAIGAQAPPPPSVFAGVTGMRCEFPRGAAGTWRPDGTADAAARPTKLTLRFEGIDADSGTAQLRTGAVTSDVTIRLAEGYLHFMQAFRTGPLYTTTVFAAGAKDGRFKAVHSRHELFTTPLAGATSSPEQYYGACDALK
jgi:hypothetical protein